MSSENSNFKTETESGKKCCNIFSRVKKIASSFCSKNGEKGSCSVSTGGCNKKKAMIMFAALVCVSTLISVVVSRVVVKNYIKNNPKAIISSIEEMQKEEVDQYKEKAMAEFMKSVLESKGLHGSFGKLNGKENVLFFADFNCKYCKKQYSEFRKILSENVDINVILIPLPLFGGVNPLLADNYVLNVAPEKYEGFVEKIFSYEGALDKKQLISAVSSLGINTDQLIKTIDLLESVINSKGAKDAKEADQNKYISNVKQIMTKVSQLPVLDRNAGGGAVPVLYINGKLLTGYQTADQIKANLKK